MTRRILVVDDEPMIVSLLTMQLEMGGYSVLSAPSGPAALELIEREPVDFVLLDYRMPGMYGDRVSIELRRRGVRVPIALLTADGHAARSRLLEDSGADACWIKPLTMDELLSRVGTLLGSA